MDYRKFTLARIEAFLKQIDLLNETHFPYEDSNSALIEIKTLIAAQKSAVENSPLKGYRLMTRCAASTLKIYELHRFVGYIANSADTINAFEVYFSFRRLAETILGKETRLIISSEWENYSPVNFNIPDELIRFVFLGLPVSEAENALIVPLNGHELGHTIWKKFNFEDKYRGQIQQLIQSRLKNSSSNAELAFFTQISLKKCAEYFCDFIGLGIFGPSYLFALSYLLAPKISKSISQSHPNGSNRADALIQASLVYGFDVPNTFKDLFKTQMIASKNLFEKGLEASENISFSLVDQLIGDVRLLLEDKSVLYSKPHNYDVILKEFLAMVPTGFSSNFS